MKLMRWSYLIIFLMSFSLSNEVYACSGSGLGVTTIEDQIESVDVIVKGKTFTYPRGTNGIAIEVEYYLKGGEDNDKFLLIYPQHYNVGYFEGLGGPQPCNLFGSGWAQGEGYFYLSQKELGFYRIVSSTIFNNDHELILISDSDGEPYEIHMDDVEFGEFLFTELSIKELIIPKRQSYPHANLVHITTENNHHYVLPAGEYQIEPLNRLDYINIVNEYVEFGLPEHCETPACIRYTPNRLYIGILDQPNRIFINRHAYSGRDLLFSPTSDAALIWDEDQLKVRLLYYLSKTAGILIQDIPSYSFEIESDVISDSNHTAWSPDGRIIAFSDKRGLWLWDALNPNAMPELLIASDENSVPFARYFSPMGRYLAITHGDTRYNLDLVSGERLSDGLFSPSERNLLAFDSSAELLDLQLCFLLLDTCGKRDWVMGYAESDNFYESYVITWTDVNQVEWISDTHFIVSACGYFEGVEYCGAAINSLTATGSQIVSIGREFDYEPILGNFAAIVDEYVISFGVREIDLSNQLDSPIVKVELLPPFYKKQ